MNNDWLEKSYRMLPKILVPAMENRIGILTNRSPRNIKAKNSLKKMALFEYISGSDLTWYNEWVKVWENGLKSIKN